MDELWSRVEKPARYTGGEYHAVIKEGAKIRFAFCFPDLYEVGMSHLGLKILYQIINSRPDAWCERAFAPFVDMERELRQAGEPLRTLESHTPLSEMDLVGFTLQYEMSYTNILTMLALPMPTPTRPFSSPTTISAEKRKLRPPLTTLATRFTATRRSLNSDWFSNRLCCIWETSLSLRSPDPLHGRRRPPRPRDRCTDNRPGRKQPA